MSTLCDCTNFVITEVINDYVCLLSQEYYCASYIQVQYTENMTIYLIFK